MYTFSFFAETAQATTHPDACSFESGGTGYCGELSGVRENGLFIISAGGGGEVRRSALENRGEH